MTSRGIVRSVKSVHTDYPILRLAFVVFVDTEYKTTHSGSAEIMFVSVCFIVLELSHFAAPNLNFDFSVSCGFAMRRECGKRFQLRVTDQICLSFLLFGLRRWWDIHSTRPLFAPEK